MQPENQTKMDAKVASFSSLGISSVFLKALERLEHKQPYPIQEQAIPAILKGKDVLGIAKTGSGKTLSYVLPILQRLLAAKWELPNRHIAALILVPTRELAVQVHQVFKDLGEGNPHQAKSLAVYGGVSINPQMIQMQGVEVLVATPGRLLDLLSSKALHLSNLKVLVLDEADKMLNYGFREEMNSILAQMPKKRQNLLFSATVSREVEYVTELVLHKAQVIEIASKEEEIELIKQRAFRVQEERKGPFLRYLIKSMELDQVLIFTSSTRSADRVVDKLNKNGIQAKASHGKKSHHARQAALLAFKKKELRVLVATDLLSRGIDIEFLPYVINYELPRSPKAFIHRIGRTGRAEQTGEAFTLVTPDEQGHFKVIQKKMGRWLTLESTDEVNLHGF